MSDENEPITDDRLIEEYEVCYHPVRDGGGLELLEGEKIIHTEADEDGTFLNVWTINRRAVR